ncbi:MAG: hypothetical protein GY841_22340, partial [FCB group bacterium]|nr:hypothetical protein [FCB group bacterium]
SKIALWNNYPLPVALLGDFGKAKTLIARSFPYLDGYKRDKAIYYENLGWIHLLAGEYDQALDALKHGLEISMEIAPKSDLVSQIKRRMADAYFGLKDYTNARKLSAEAMKVSEHLNERVEIAACHRVDAQLEVVAGNDDTARSLFKRAINLFAMIESNYDLAVTRHIAATSGLYHNGERQALLYLARVYFVSEEVTHYVTKIDSALHSTKMPKAVKHNNSQAFIAESPRMKKIVEMADMIAPSQMSILLTGDTGTGKDHLAKYIHDVSGMTGEFVSINISAIPNDMIEAELFGHR